MPVHPDKPFIGGVCFSDLYGMDPSVRADLIHEGMVFVTTLHRDGREYGGTLIARHIEHARQRADARGFGETVEWRLERLLEAK